MVSRPLHGKTQFLRQFRRAMTLDPRDGIVEAKNLSPTPRGLGSPRELPPDPPRIRWIVRALQLVVPAAVAVAVLSVLVGERARVDCDLQLQTPRQARPGSTLPVRGLFYTGLQSIEGPRLSATQATVELLDGAQRVLLKRSMARGLGNTLEASLPIAATLRGPFKVRVVTHDAQSAVTVEQAFTVAETAPPLPAQPRPLRPLQQFAAGPLRRAAQGSLPSAFDAQVIGGACAPEFPCEVLVHVGEPAAVIGVEPYGALEVVTPPPTNPTADIVRFSVRTHGPEAELRLVASIDGVAVARRTFRLPIGQAMFPIAVPSLWTTPQSPIAFRRAVGQGNESGCIVDVFHEDRWIETTTFDRCANVTLALSSPLQPGLWRVQTRDDAFGGDAAATRLVYVRRADESATAILSTLATRVLAVRPDDLMARRLVDRAAQFSTRDPEGYVTWLLSSLEDQLVILPAPVSSYPLALNALEEKRARLRMFCLVALLLSAIAAVSLVARRGLHASARARDIMEDAGDPEAHSRARRARMTLTVVASAASIAVAFLAIALYVIARG